MDADWISPFWQAFIMPVRSQVCGIRVPPLSVWHVFALENVGNTYLTGGIVNEGDVLQLLAVVTQTRRQFLRTMHSPRRLARHTARIRKAMLRAAYRGREADPVRACMAYAEQSMRIAGRWVKDGSKSCSVPHPLHVLAAAVKCGIGYERAWDTPYATARAMFDVFAEQRGDESIQSAAGQQVDEAMAAEKAESKEAANG